MDFEVADKNFRSVDPDFLKGIKLKTLKERQIVI
jgi:hypothetical protein